MPASPSRLPLLLFLALALALPVGASAQSAGDAAIDACHEKESTSDIVDCLDRLTAQWDKQLNASYQLALKSADPAGVTPLRAAERAWLEYRKQRCYYRGAGEGTIMRVLAADCFVRMTKARAEELAEDAKGLGG